MTDQRKPSAFKRTARRDDSLVKPAQPSQSAPVTTAETVPAGTPINPTTGRPSIFKRRPVNEPA